MFSIGKMLRIDSHQHFWKYDPLRHSWINEDMVVLKRDFLPKDLAPILNLHDFDGCIVVQADQAEQENEFLLNLAGRNDFIKGIVGWVDLRSPDLEGRLEYYQQFPKMKGFRHVLQDEEQRDLMLTKNFMNGINSLSNVGFTYDILIHEDQLIYAEKLVAANPDQRFVIDHIAKPRIRDKKVDLWKNNIIAIAKHNNVYCKLSGMVTEADWRNWKPEDFHPYLETVINAFGMDRVMYGSDWPVCNLVCSYEEMLKVLIQYFSQYSEEDNMKIFGGNATKFYQIG